MEQQEAIRKSNYGSRNVTDKIVLTDHKLPTAH